MQADATTAQQDHRFGHVVDIQRVGMVFQARAACVEALDDIDLHIKGGEFVSIVGPSGCGKSTLLRLIAGLAFATSGEVRLNGAVVDKAQTEIGFVFQKPVLLDWRSVIDNVMLQIEARRLPRDAYLKDARELLAKAGLAEFETAYPHELSGGMSQRASVCRALVHNPPLLLMDEPFGALDALTRDQMMIDLQRLWMSSRQTVVFVTHSVAEAIFLSDRIVVMSPRPGHIRKVIDIDLPRPRRLSLRSSALFNEISGQILGFFEEMGVIREDREDEEATIRN